ncbi:zinc finger, CCHC-type containing protein [Tanacetum coccineum]
MDLNKFIVKDDMIDYVLHEYESNWQVHDAIADDILDDLLKREWEKQQRVKYDKRKVTEIKILELLEQRIEKVRKHLNKKKQIMVINKGKEKMEELTLVELGSHLRIEESLRVQDSDKPKGNNVAGPSVVNMVEHNNSSRYNDNKGKRKHHDNTRADPNKKAKPTCWKCGKTGHIKRDCKGVNVGNKANGSGTKGSVDGSSNSLKGQNMFNKSFQVYYVTYVSEAYFVQDDDVAWWVDSGATIHLCKDRCWFKTYESLNDGSIHHMVNESTVLVHGRGYVDLRFSSGKIVSLFNVLHVPNIRKNLVSSSVLNNYGYKQPSSTSKLNDSILWHARPWNKKYFVTFIDDGSRFCYVYLVHSKDEALDKFKVFQTEVELQQGSQIKRFRTDRGGLGQGFWGEAMLTACYLLNRVPNKRNRITSYELWTKRKPNLNYLRVWGYRKVVRLPNSKLKTLGERGIECIFVGYSEHSKAFRFYVIEPNDSVSINSIIESKDAIFDENRFSSVPRPSLRIPNGTEDIGGSVVPEEVTEEVVQQPEPELKKSKRNRTPKNFGPEFQLYLIERTRDGDVDFWKEAINDEMDSIMGNNTWVLADLPPGCKPLGCKWIFKRKLKVDGSIEKFKARLVIRGFKQKSGIDYFDTYAPVSCISTIRLLIAMALIYNLIIHRMDVKTAFLNSDLDEEVLYEGHRGRGVDVILGIRIKHEGNGIAISQSHYIEKVLKKFNYIDCTPVSTPMDTSEKLMPNNGQAVSQLEYSRVISCLMYAMTCIRPDITFVVGKLSRYTSNPGTQHWQAIQRVLKYLKKTMDYRLTYTGYPSVLEGYTDASWISNTEDNSSTSGWVFMLGGGAISWASKKQTCITGSTMESEFVALAAAGKEAKWLENLLLEILLWSKPIAPISICCDSVATLAKAYSQMYNGKSRHLGIRHSMIREIITNGVISIDFVRSQQNLADHLTKGLARDLVIKSAKGMGLKSN